MRMTVSEARAALPAIVDRVMAGEEITLTRHGEPVAVVVSPRTLRARRADDALAAAERVRAAIARGRSSPLSPRPGVSEQRAAALVETAREARAKR